MNTDKSSLTANSITISKYLREGKETRLQGPHWALHELIVGREEKDNEWTKFDVENLSLTIEDQGTFTFPKARVLILGEMDPVEGELTPEQKAKIDSFSTSS